MNYKKELLNDILPFWLNNSIDYENGGIFTQVDKKGNIFKGPFHIPRLYMIMAILNETGDIENYAK